MDHHRKTAVRLIVILIILSCWDSTCDAGAPVLNAQLSLRIASAVCGAFSKFNQTGTLTEGRLEFIPDGVPSVVGCEVIEWEVCENATAADYTGLMSLGRCGLGEHGGEMKENPWDVHFHYNASEGSADYDEGFGGYRQEKKTAPRCGGVFYSKKVILTSASCCHRSKMNGGMLAACVSRDRWRHTQWLNQNQDFEMHIHPDWLISRAREKDNDLCIIKLNKGLEESLKRKDVEGLAIRDTKGFSEGAATHQTWPLTPLKLSTGRQILSENEEFPGIASTRIEVDVRLESPECEKRITQSLGTFQKPHVPTNLNTMSRAEHSTYEFLPGSGHSRKYLCVVRPTPVGPSGSLVNTTIQKIEAESIEGSALVCTGRSGNKFLCGIRNGWEVRMAAGAKGSDRVEQLFGSKKFPTRPPIYLKKNSTISTNSTDPPANNSTGNATMPEVTTPPTHPVEQTTTAPSATEPSFWTFIRPEYYVDWIIQVAGPQEIKEPSNDSSSSWPW